MNRTYKLVFALIFATIGNVIRGQECPKVKTVQVSSGTNHTIFLMSNGDVYSSGKNMNGQLGLGTKTMLEKVPNKIESLKNIKQVSAGGESSLCITEEGIMYSWGVNNRGQLGDRTGLDREYPVKVVDGNIAGGNVGVSFISAGFNHSLCIKDGKVYGWGGNRSGQLGDGKKSMLSKLPVKVRDGAMGNADVSVVSAGEFFSLALKDGQVYSWGGNIYGQLGDGTRILKNIPVKVHNSSLSGEIMMNEGVTSIVSGRGYSLAVRSGVVYGWGDNSYAQLGGSKVNKLIPTKVASGDVINEDIINVSVANRGSYALKSSGEICAWGQLENGSKNVVEEMSKVNDENMENGRITCLSRSIAGSTMIVIKQDNIYAWGNNMNGEYGDGKTVSSIIPIHTNSILENLKEYLVLESKNIGDNEVELTVVGNDAPYYDVYFKKDGKLIGRYLKNKINLKLDLNIENEIIVQNKYGCYGEIVIGGDFLVTLIDKKEEGCEGINDGMIEIGIKKGVPPYNIYLNEMKIEEGITTDNCKIKYLSKGIYRVKVTDNTNDIRIVDVEIGIVEPAIAVVDTKIENEACKKKNGSVAITLKGGVKPYNVVLKSEKKNVEGKMMNDSIYKIDSLSSGVYTIEIEDARKCKNFIKNVEIKEDLGIQVSLEKIDREVCGGKNGGIGLNIEGGVKSYEVVAKKVIDDTDKELVEVRRITVNNNSCYISYLEKGVYIIEVFDARKCKSTFVGVKIEEKLDLEAVKGKIVKETCHKGNGSVQIDIIGGTKPYKVVVKKKDDINGTDLEVKRMEVNEDIFNLSDLESGDYTLEILDERGCKVVEKVKIEKASEFRVVVEKMVKETNNKGDGSIRITVEGGTKPYEVVLKKEEMEIKKMSINEDTFDIVDLSGGVYVVEVSDANKCKEVTENLDIRMELIATVEKIIRGKCGRKDGKIVINIERGTKPYMVALKKDGIYVHEKEELISDNVHYISNVGKGLYDIEIEDAKNLKYVIENVKMDDEGVSLALGKFGVETCVGVKGGWVEMKIENRGLPYNIYLDGKLLSKDIEDQTYIIEGLSSGSHEIKVEDIIGCMDKKIHNVESKTDVSISVDKEGSCKKTSDGWIEISLNTDTLLYDIYLNDNLIAKDLKNNKYKIEGLSEGIYRLKLTGFGNNCEIFEIVRIGNKPICSEDEELKCLGKPYIVFKGEEKLVFECVNMEKYKIYLKIVDSKGAEVYKNDNYSNETIEGIKNDTFLTLFYMLKLTNKNTGKESEIYTSYIERIKKD